MSSLWSQLYYVRPGEPTAFYQYTHSPTRDNGELFVGCALGYLALIWLLVRFMRDRKPYNLRTFLIIWNGTLSIASAVGAVILVPYLINELQDMGFYRFICSEHWHRVPSVVIVMGAFVWSKIPELVDTVLLALRKREIMLLHWYHHVTVLLFVWWSSHHNVGGTGVIFSGMNLVVHAIMYGYYALGSMGFRPPFPIAITLLQIAQMIVGTYVVIASIPCSTYDSTTYSALAMYSSYFVLFMLFFLNRYVFSGKKATARPADQPRVSAETRVNKYKIH